MVLVDQRPHVFIAIDVRDFVINRIGAEVDQPPYFQVFFGQPRCSRNVENRVCVSE